MSVAILAFVRAFPQSGIRALMQCMLCLRERKWGQRLGASLVHRSSGWHYTFCQPCWNSAYRAASKLELTDHLDTRHNRHLVNNECAEDLRRAVARQHHVPLEKLAWAR